MELEPILNATSKKGVEGIQINLEFIKIIEKEDKKSILNDTLLFILKDLKNLIAHKIEKLFNLCKNDQNKKEFLIEKLIEACDTTEWQSFSKKYSNNNGIEKMLVYFNGVLNSNNPQYLRETEVYTDIFKKQLFSNMLTVCEQQNALKAIQPILKDFFKKEIKKLDNNRLER